MVRKGGKEANAAYMREYRRRKKEEDRIFKLAAREITQILWLKKGEERRQLIQRVLDKYGLKKLEHEPHTVNGFGTKASEEKFLEALELEELDRLQPLIKQIVEREADAMFKRLIQYFSEGLLHAHLRAYAEVTAKRKYNNGHD